MLTENVVLLIKTMAKLAVLVAGVTLNFILGWANCFTSLWFKGVPVPSEYVVVQAVSEIPAADAGLLKKI